jgi:hypothetical protein
VTSIGRVELQVSDVAADFDHGSSDFTFAVGRAALDDRSAVRVLSPVPSSAPSQALVERSSCIRLPDGLDVRRALAVPMLATALWAWDELDLELGDASVYTTGSALERMIGCVAIWRGALPVARLGNDGTRVLSGTQPIAAADPHAAMRQLAETVRAAPGFAAIDLTGRGEVLDILLEVAPRWGRILLGAPTSSRLTVDFYNNVHRKGTYLRTARLDPLLVFDSTYAATRLPHVARAIRILADDELAARCLSDG